MFSSELGWRCAWFVGRSMVMFSFELGWRCAWFVGRSMFMLSSELGSGGIRKWNPLFSIQWHREVCDLTASLCRT